MLIIGICGASGSGKSTLADELARRLDEPCVLLKQDSYYKDHPDMDFAQRERINYDEPEAFEHEALRADLEALRAGRSITRKGYDYKQHRRCDSQERISPRRRGASWRASTCSTTRRCAICWTSRSSFRWTRTSACCGACSATSSSADGTWTASPGSIWKRSNPCLSAISATTWSTRRPHRRARRQERPHRRYTGVLHQLRHGQGRGVKRGRGANVPRPFPLLFRSRRAAPARIAHRWPPPAEKRG